MTSVNHPIVTMKKSELLELFLNLCRIDSPSGEEKSVGEYIIKHLARHKISAGRDAYGNVIARVPGEGKPLVISAHLDTVEPGRGVKPVVRNGVVRSDGRTILGADDKAGLAAAIAVTQEAVDQGRRIRPLELVFTRQEETDLDGVRNLDWKQIRAREGFILDGSDDPGRITIAAPYIYNVDITVKGRAAHAGVEPEKGINALAIAADAISQLKLGRIDRQTTANIGTLAAGSASNAIPAEAVMRAEARSHSQTTALAQVEAMKGAFNRAVRRRRGAKLSFKSSLACRGYRYDKKDPLIKELKAAMAAHGWTVAWEESCGASDANVWAEKRIKAVEISVGYRDAHSTGEWIKVDDLWSVFRFLAAYIQVK
jgi:tripeptide aminopeptidase